jgi:hypothetical protein
MLQVLPTAFFKEFMNKLILTIFLILIASPAWAEYTFAQDWTKTDTILEGIFIAETVIDWGQTRDIALRPSQYAESNPILGKHPSLSKVDTYFPVAIIAHGVISMALPPKYRKYWQLIWIGIETGATINNASGGVRIEF